MAEAEISRPGLQANLLQVMELLRKQRSAEAQGQIEEPHAPAMSDNHDAELQSRLDELHPASRPAVPRSEAMRSAERRTNLPSG